jgi:adenylate cyclase class 2
MPVMSQPPTETEVKIPVTNLSVVRGRLAASAGACVQPAEREINVLFDRVDGRLKAAGSVLRVRRYGGRWVLTYKGPSTYRGAVREREELELEVADGEVLAAVFAHLGLEPDLRYEKDREVWRLGSVEVVLDHTPLGDFVEIEGREADILRAAAALGLDPADAVRGSYVRLWERRRSEHPELGLPRDMVFPPEEG